MELDLAFLQMPLNAARVPARAVNVYEILREGWRETRVDMTLLFFLDPSERHGLGTTVIDALLTTLDGAPIIDRTGPAGTHFDAPANVGSDAWEIAAQVEYIDVYAVNRELGLAVVLENKIGHVLNNPLDRYARSALVDPDVKTLLVAVLAPERRAGPVEQQRWLSRAITYAELAAAIKASPALVEHLLGPRDRNKVRSLELLEQFMEARSGGVTMSELEDEAKRIDEWRHIIDLHGEAITRFEEARRRARQLIRDRGKRLEPLISARLDEAGLVADWESHSGSTVEFWNAYHFPHVEWTIELKFCIDPTLPPIYVYDYEGRTYEHEQIRALDVPWTASDVAIADAFVARVAEILASRASEGG